MRPINNYSEFPHTEDKSAPFSLQKAVGKSLFHSASHFYEVCAPWALPKEEKLQNLKYLAIIMRISKACSLTEGEEQKALHLFKELNEGLKDGTLKKKETSTFLKEITIKLTDKNMRSKIVSQLIELDYRNREYHISLEESKNFQSTIDHLIENIAHLPTTRAKAISKEITILDSQSLSRTLLTKKLYEAVQNWLPK